MAGEIYYFPIKFYMYNCNLNPETLAPLEPLPGVEILDEKFDYLANYEELLTEGYTHMLRAYSFINPTEIVLVFDTTKTDFNFLTTVNSYSTEPVSYVSDIVNNKLYITISFIIKELPNYGGNDRFISNLLCLPTDYNLNLDVEPDLLTNKYYLNYLSLFMKNSLGIKERCTMYVDILNNLNDTAIKLLNKFDVFGLYNPAKNYFVLNKPDDYETVKDYRNGFEDKILDLIASFYNIKRTFNLKYVDSYGFFGDINTSYNETVTLSNYELLIYIQFTISKNNFNGTNLDLLELYNGSNETNEVKNLGIKYVWGDTLPPLTCLIFSENILNLYNTNPNLVKMYIAGKLTIESLGIQYIKYPTASIFLAEFDSEDALFDPSMFDLYAVMK